MNILDISISELKQYENNPRINEDAIEGVANSIREFGFKVPIIIDSNNVIIAGHTRLLASQKLGLEKVPCIIADDLTEEQIKAFRLADNKVSEFSTWDFSKLEKELSEIEMDMSLFNFDEEELIKEFDKLKNVENDNFDIDAELEKETIPTVKRGEVWKLGNHFLMCGDSTNKNDVEKLLNGEKINCVFSSPPYNMNKGLYNSYSDNLASDEYIDFNLSVIKNIVDKLNGFVFWNISYNFNSRSEFLTIAERMKESLIFKDLIVWNKQKSLPNKCKTGLKRTFELIFVYESKKNIEYNQICVSNVWDITPNNIQLENHQACFPIELPTRGITLSTKQNDNVYEPFCGSGTTLIACEKLNRNCYAMELDEQYCDVIIKRWESESGKVAEKIESN